MARVSPSPQPSGRRVKHSRSGCASCKARRLRCSEGRPSCTRCLDDGLSCEYVLRLIWKDESSQRGVKHGRGKHAEYTFADPTPSGELVGIGRWDPPRNQRRHFLNTARDDFDGTQVRSLVQLNQLYRRGYTSRLRSAPQTIALSTANGMLFQYYQAQVCQTLTLVDDTSNCYRQIILPLSVSHNCVMRSILAVGALCLSIGDVSASEEYYALALYQKQKTLQQLRLDIASLNGKSSNHILVSMLMLCLFDITDNCQTSWSTHVSAAANLIGMANSQSLEPSLVSFVSKFFATRDVMGRSACGKRANFKEIAWENPQEVDKSVGCSSQLLAIISSITDVARQMVDSHNMDTQDLVGRVTTLELQLADLVQMLPASDSALPSEELILVQTSTLIHNAAKIYFYTALRSAVPSTPIIRRLVTTQLSLIKRMTTMRSAHLWSVFVTALYALEDEERIFFLEQFDKLKVVSATRGSTQAARSIVQTVWKKRDLDADSNLLQDPGLSDWVRLVRPISEALTLSLA